MRYSYTFSCIKKSNVKGVHILSRLAIYCVIFFSFWKAVYLKKKGLVPLRYTLKGKNLHRNGANYFLIEKTPLGIAVQEKQIATDSVCLVKRTNRYTLCIQLYWSVLYLSRGMTTQTKWLRAQRRLRSAWASAQSDQRLCCPHEEILSS